MTANAVAKIKAYASKVLAKLVGPNVDIETYMERGEWERIPRFMKLTVQTTVKELSAMYDEAEGKFSDADLNRFSFDMASVGKMVKRVKYIKERLNLLAKADA